VTRRPWTRAAAAALALTAAAFAAAGAQPAQRSRGDLPGYAVVPAFPALTFRRPVDLQSPRDGSGRLFVVEQDGVIQWFENRSDVKTAGVFLDIRDRVNTDGNEMGLLGLAFHPDFAKNATFFVDYTASKLTRRITRVSRFRVGPYKNAADVASEETVIEVGQPYSNHNGGQVAFGPDGFLYIALGDGGSGGDPQGNGQDLRSLLGKILRLDVAKTPYAIPPDNPLKGKGGGAKEEVFAWGLRNPWRFSFDRETGALWAADVGQVTWEEIDLVEKGKNYGWDCREGFHPYAPARERSEACESARDLVDPVFAYGREEGISVTGGYVYYGSALPDLLGWYVYADYGSGKVWALRIEDGSPINRLLADTNLLISSFGLDESGEIYLCAHDPGGSPTKIYRFAPK
jgi:glucose/arabinose dehydrogenase